MTIKNNLEIIQQQLPKNVTLVAVSKTKPIEDIMQVYEAGHKIFGENKVQEMCDKWKQLPKDIQWHMIGHLQTNKVKYIAPFVHLIHGVDSFKLLKEINKQAQKNNRVINVLLQIHIAKESTKFGLNTEELDSILNNSELQDLKYVRVVGLMGMATFTDDIQIIKNEFYSLKLLFDYYKTQNKSNVSLDILSMGMSGDYKIAIDFGSTMVRVGSSIFGTR